MEEKPVEITEKESFLVKAKKWVGNAFDNSVGFIVKNPMLIAPLASIIIGGFTALTNGGEKRYDKCKVEDDLTGEEFIVKHPLTNDEILELGDRMVGGFPKGRALEDMGLLKNEKRRK